MRTSDLYIYVCIVLSLNWKPSPTDNASNPDYKLMNDRFNLLYSLPLVLMKERERESRAQMHLRNKYIMQIQQEKTVKPKPPKKRRGSDILKKYPHIFVLLSQGVSQTEIAQLYGVNRSALSRAINAEQKRLDAEHQQITIDTL